MTFTEVMDVVVRGFEAAGVAVLVSGGLIALAAFTRDLMRGEPRPAYDASMARRRNSMARIRAVADSQLCAC